MSAIRGSTSKIRNSANSCSSSTSSSSSSSDSSSSSSSLSYKNSQVLKGRREIMNNLNANSSLKTSQKSGKKFEIVENSTNYPHNLIIADNSSVLESGKEKPEGLEAAPQYRIIDGSDGQHIFEITYDVSNFQPENVKITLEEKNLVVTAKREEKKGTSTITREFKRQLEIPSSVDANQFQCIWDSKNKLKVSAPLKLSEERASRTSHDISSKHKLSDRSTLIEKRRSHALSLPINSSGRTSANYQGNLKSERLSRGYELYPAAENQSRYSRKFSSEQSCASGNVRKSISGSFYETIMDLNDESLLNCRDIRVEFEQKNLTIRIIFRVEMLNNCWNEIKEVIRSTKLPKSLNYGDITKTRVYLNKLSRNIIINVPLNEVRSNELKELRVNFKKR